MRHGLGTMAMFNKTFLKFFGGGLVIVLLSLALIYGLDYYHYRRSPEYQAQKYFEDLRRQYEQDTYGGDTPEETLRLFIDALKNGDIELASKYFVVDEQEKWKGNLQKLADKQLLILMISDLQRKKYKSELDDGRIFFEIANDNNEVALTIDMGRGLNGKWKIIDL